MKKVRIGVIGCGNMRMTHGAIYSAIENVSIVACCDIKAEKAKEFADIFKIPYYTDYREMFDKEKLDGVSVVTTDPFHKEPTMEALKRNIHCLCEKPLSDNLADAKEMKELAEAKLKDGILTCVNFTYRNFGVSQKLAELIKSGEYGKVISFEGHYRQSWIPTGVVGKDTVSDSALWRLSKEKGSLGTLGDLGVHIYDLVRFAVGDIDELCCRMETFDKNVKQKTDFKLDANETVFTIAKLKNGGSGVIDASRWGIGYGNEVSVKVFYEKGSFDLNLDRIKGGQLKACIGENNIKNKIWEYIPCEDTPNNHKRFVDSIVSGKQGQTCFALGYEVQKLLSASLESAEKNIFVKVN